MKVLERPCPLCGSRNTDAAMTGYSPAEWPMKECASCGMTYLEKVPDVSELYEALAWEKTSKIEDRRREVELGWTRKASRLTRSRLHLLPRKTIRALVGQYATDGKVLDVGCGRGTHVLSLPERYTPYGIEVSKVLAATHRDQFLERGGDIVNRDALSGLQTLADGAFTAIIMRSFLEHEIHPLPVLREAHRGLREGGILIIKVPNFGSLNRKVRGRRWCGLRFPDHVNYFTPKTLSTMVLRAGFSIRRFGLLDRLPTSDNMWLIATKP